MFIVNSFRNSSQKRPFVRRRQPIGLSVRPKRWCRTHGLVLAEHEAPRRRAPQKPAISLRLEVAKSAASIACALLFALVCEDQARNGLSSSGTSLASAAMESSFCGTTSEARPAASEGTCLQRFLESLQIPGAFAADLTGFVEDDTGTSPGSVVSRVNSSLQALVQNTGYRVFILIKRDIPLGTDLNSLAREVYESKNGDGNLLVLVLNPKTAKGGYYAGDQVQRAIPNSVLMSIANETYPFNTLQGKYGAALLDVTNRLEAVLSGRDDPGPPVVRKSEKVASFKTREETESQRKKYVGVVATLLIISVVAPMAQYFWYQRK